MGPSPTPKSTSSIRTAIRFNTIDSTVALTIAFFVNAAILVLAAMVFYGKESVTVAGGDIVKFGGETDWIRVAYLTLAPLLPVVANPGAQPGDTDCVLGVVGRGRRARLHRRRGVRVGGAEVAGR